MAKSDKTTGVRFTATQGEKGLLMIAGPDGIAKQATTYTRDGNALRFSLEGDGGAVYSVVEGDPDFEALAAAFAEAGVGDEPEEPAAPKPTSGSKTPAASAAGGAASA